MPMSENTRLTLIDATNKALKSRNVDELHAMQHLLQIKCYQGNVSWLAFIVDEVLPASKRNVPNMKAENEHHFGQRPATCPYCEREFRNSTGLKAHLGRKHPDKKHEWSNSV